MPLIEMDMFISPVDRIRNVAKELLDPHRPAQGLQEKVQELAALFEQLQTFHTSEETVCIGHPRTEHGLAIRPKDAASCLADHVRTIEYLRSLHEAIIDIRRRVTDRPVRVLYPGCGPYGTLAVPVMSVLPSHDAKFTLIDVYRESVESLKSMVMKLGLGESLEKIEVANAASYQIDSDALPDLVILEVMLAALKDEPQVAITRNLLMQAPRATVIPEEVRVDLVMADPAIEFGPGMTAHDLERKRAHRIHVGQVFMLNREMVLSWKREAGNHLPASRLRIPVRVNQSLQPFFFTGIRLYKEHVIKEYESGLTHPVAANIEDPIRPGSEVQFCYDLGGYPGLRGSVTAVNNARHRIA